MDLRTASLLVGLSCLAALGCQKKVAEVVESDDAKSARILASIQGAWRSSSISCGAELPKDAKTVALLESTFEVHDKTATLRSVKTDCETTLAFDIVVERGELSWKNGRVSKTTCKGPQQPPIGTLKFNVEVSGPYLKLDPANRSSMPCGVLVKG